MEKLNNNKSTEEAIDYEYGNLSVVDTATLKEALVSYKNLHTNGSRGNEAITNRIEGELLGRREIKVSEDSFSTE